MAATTQCGPGTGNPRSSPQYVVRFASSAAASDAMQAQTISRLAAGSGAKSTWVRRTAQGDGVIRFSAKDPAAIARAVQTLQQRSDVAYIVPDVMVHPTLIPSDPKYPEQWALRSSQVGIGADVVWDASNGRGEGVVIAVVDSGATVHPDLTANTLPGYDFITEPGMARDGDGRDATPTDMGDYVVSTGCASVSTNSTWHGTHVAGIAAAVGDNSVGVAGVAYAARIVHARALGDGGGRMLDVADAIVWAAGGSVPGVPANLHPAGVINVSWGVYLPCGPVERNAIALANSLGAVVVAAAGNTTTDASAFSPASCEGVITVAGTNDQGARVPTSNFGPSIDISAPGAKILSTFNDGKTTPGNPTYSAETGTSMAAPHVAGVWR